MALPREPRQKMINMMYLVLTAMLALNVSSEILNAFKTVNNSLQQTSEVVGANTSEVMSSLLEKKSEASTKAKADIWYLKAEEAQRISESVNSYIKFLKDSILSEAGANFAKGDSSYKDDNLDIPTRLLVDKDYGRTLRKKLTDMKQDILKIDPLIAEHFAKSLPINLDIPKTKNKGNKTWEAAYFRMVPTVAALTILSKFQNDVKTAENKVVTFCHEQVGKVVHRQDAFAALALANSTNLLPGQKLEITAGVGGFSKAVSPVITIGGQTVQLGEDGAAHLELTAQGIGAKSVPVVIKYTDQDGNVQSIEKRIDYMVGQSNAAVQLDKMNVLFIGVDNPVTVSGSGSLDQLKVSISGGGGVLTKTSTGYTARVNQETDNCIISVTTPDQRTTPVKFRVRTIPDPTPMIGTYESGEIPANIFTRQAGVRAFVKNFFYETQFNVTSFRITGDGTGFDNILEANNTGAAWNEARKIISQCRPGSFVTIEDIYAMGPDGRRRKLTPLIFNLR